MCNVPASVGAVREESGGGPVDVGEETVARGRPDSGGLRAPHSRRENRDSLFSEVPTYSSQRS